MTNDGAVSELRVIVKGHTMNIFMTIWGLWGQLFSLVPYGDPYVAAGVAVVVSIALFKSLRFLVRQL